VLYTFTYQWLKYIIYYVCVCVRVRVCVRACVCVNVALVVSKCIAFVALYFTAEHQMLLHVELKENIVYDIQVTVRRA